MKVEMTGKVIRVEDTETFGNDFKKRTIIVEIESGDYPNQVPIEAVKDKCALFDKFKEGDQVEVSAFLNGNHWAKGDKWFLSLRLSFIKLAEGAESKPAPKPDDQEAGEPF
jgi:hypothetical protein